MAVSFLFKNNEFFIKMYAIIFKEFIFRDKLSETLCVNSVQSRKKEVFLFILCDCNFEKKNLYLIKYFLCIQMIIGIKHNTYIHCVFARSNMQF